MRHLPARPLPERPYLPGRRLPRPAPDDGPLEEALAWGADLWNHGFYWEAHEVWERPWRLLPAGAERELLQGLIQCAAAHVKRLLGEAGPAARLLERGCARLAVVRAFGLDGAELAAEVRARFASGAPALVIR